MSIRVERPYTVGRSNLQRDRLCQIETGIHHHLLRIYVSALTPHSRRSHQNYALLPPISAVAPSRSEKHPKDLWSDIRLDSVKHVCRRIPAHRAKQVSPQQKGRGGFSLRFYVPSKSRIVGLVIRGSLQSLCLHLRFAFGFGCCCRSRRHVQCDVAIHPCYSSPHQQQRFSIVFRKPQQREKGVSPGVISCFIHRLARALFHNACSIKV